MSTDASDPTPARPQRSLVNRLSMYGLVLLAAFLLGLMPMWLRARAAEAEVAAAERQLRVVELENALAAAAVLARRGQYVEASDVAGRFFRQAGEDVDNLELELPDEQRAALRTALGERDQVLALLSRNDPAAAERLANLYAAHREARLRR